ncbi:hypothetical protein [Asticcacaulis sp. AC402]|uniref:hypothetical protein n=1 Tax=Asticcacaulis sp. AC402 TaxID=1282361 RepID=UPI0003C3D591|nr:hypothetical protein [Asticcacaulis sp. AC402]ESQ76721.1 hypothetical protein ABAC402_03330 [Asticcacaulis sp. AC402]
MPKRKLPGAIAFTRWTSLGWQTAQMMAASAQVIRHRVNRMAMAQFPLSPKDRTEFMLMGQEKAAAAAESIAALSLGVMRQDSPETLSRKAIKPFHSRAVANARRLKKTRT